MTKTSAILTVAALAAGCGAQWPTAPAGPTASNTTLAVPAVGASGRSSVSVAAGSPFGGNAVPFIEVAGSRPAGGSGVLNDIQTGQPGFDNFEVTINVHGAPPDTDLYFQFAPDIVPGTRGDGICPPFPALPGNTIQILHTSPGGSFGAHIKFPVPEGAFLGAFDAGAQSDWAWRLVNLEQTFDLRTPCVVLTGK